MTKEKLHLPTESLDILIKEEEKKLKNFGKFVWEEATITYPIAGGRFEFDDEKKANYAVSIVWEPKIVSSRTEGETNMNKIGELIGHVADKLTNIIEGK